MIGQESGQIRVILMASYERRTEMIEIICGTCKWHEYDFTIHDWLCVNEDCVFFHCVTDYKFNLCDGWESKDE